MQHTFFEASIKLALKRKILFSNMCTKIFIKKKFSSFISITLWIISNSIVSWFSFRKKMEIILNNCTIGKVETKSLITLNHFISLVICYSSSYNSISFYKTSVICIRTLNQLHLPRIPWHSADMRLWKTVKTSDSRLLVPTLILPVLAIDCLLVEMLSGGKVFFMIILI